MNEPNEIKLFRVTATYHTVIAAKSKEEAEKQAAWVVCYEEDDAEPDEVSATCLTSDLDLPEGWNPSCIPFGNRDPENPDKTIREYLR